MTRLKLFAGLTRTAPALMAAAEIMNRGAAVPLPNILRASETGHTNGVNPKMVDRAAVIMRGAKGLTSVVDKSASAVAAKLMGDDNGHVTGKASTDKGVRSRLAGLPGSGGNIASDLPGLLGRIGALAVGKSVPQHI